MTKIQTFQTFQIVVKTNQSTNTLKNQQISKNVDA